MPTKNTPKSKPAAAAKPAPTTSKAKDLPAKKNAKGGGNGWNHNETMVGDTAM